MKFSEHVVKRRIKGARCDQHAQFRIGSFESQALRNFSCCFQVLRFQGHVDVDRVACLLEVLGDTSNAFGQASLLQASCRKTSAPKEMTRRSPSALSQSHEPSGRW